MLAIANTRRSPTDIPRYVSTNADDDDHGGSEEVARTSSSLTQRREPNAPGDRARDDFAKSGKDAQAHQSVEGPFFSLSRYIR